MGSYPHPIPSRLPVVLVVLVGKLHLGPRFFLLCPQHLNGLGKSRKHELLKGRAAHLDGVVELFGDGPRLLPKKRDIPGKRGSPHDLPLHLGAELLHRKFFHKHVNVASHTAANHEGTVANHEGTAANHEGTVVYNPSGSRQAKHLPRSQELDVPRRRLAQVRLGGLFACCHRVPNTLSVAIDGDATGSPATHLP